MSDAAVRGARGGGVTIIGQGAKVVIQFLSVVTLSRLLSPEDFGLIAMVAAFVSLGELLRDFGTSVVGLQRKELSQQEASNLFWLATTLGVGSAALLVLCTPLLVALYGEPRLAAIVPCLALTIALNAMAAQIQVQLARSMRFGRLVAADVVAQVFGLIGAVSLALVGWSYWALVAQVLITGGLGLLFRWVASRWVPSRPARGAENLPLIRDSASFGLSQLLTYFAQNADTVVIGARWDAESLGSYSRAFQLLTAPLNSMMGPLTQVVVPTVNRARAEGKSVDGVLLRVQFSLGLVVVWIYSMTAATAQWLVPLLLGPGWDQTVHIFQILAIGGAVWVFSRVSYWRFVVENLGGQLLLYNVLTKGLSVALIVGAAFLGVEAVAWAVSIGLAISWPINLVWLARTAGQASGRFLASGLGLLSAAACAFLASWLSFQYLSENFPPGWAATLSILGGTALYIAGIIVVPGGRRALLRTVSLARRAARPGPQ